MFQSNKLDQTNPYTLHSLPTASISISSLSWHPTESVLAVTLPSGAFLLLRTNEASDGEKPPHQNKTGGDMMILAPISLSPSNIEFSDNEEMLEHSSYYDDNSKIRLDDEHMEVDPLRM